MIAGTGFFRDKIRSGGEKIGEGFPNGVFFDNGSERKAGRGWSREKKTVARRGRKHAALTA